MSILGVHHLSIFQYFNVSEVEGEQESKVDSVVLFFIMKYLNKLYISIEVIRCVLFIVPVL